MSAACDEPPAMLSKMRFFPSRLHARLLAAITVAAASALPLSACNSDATGFNMEIPPARIQAKLNESFPKENCPNQLVCVMVHTPQLALVNGSSRIGLRVQLRARSPVLQSQAAEVGGAQVSAKLRYERTEAALYLDDVKVDQLQLRGVPDAVSKIVAELGPKLIDTSFTAKPIYSIPNDRLTERMQRLALKDVYVHEGKLRVSVGL
jgi:hypothetical protein